MRYKSDEVIMKEIREQLDKWVYCLGIGWWDLDVYYLDGKDAKKNFSSKDGNIILALTYADWRYGIASIYFNLPEVKKLSSAELEYRNSLNNDVNTYVRISNSYATNGVFGL